jgi:hypothetical protein
MKLLGVIKTIWTVLNSRVFMMGVALLGFVLFLNTCQDKKELEREKIKTDQNYAAMGDSLLVIKKKNGELETSKDVFIATEKELKKLNAELYKDVKEQKGEVITLTNAVIRLEQNEADLEKQIDSLKKVIGAAEKVGKDTYKLPWKLPYTYGSDNYDIFEGKTIVKLTGDSLNPIVHKNTLLTKRVTNISLKFGQEIVDDKLRVFITSKYPGFTVSSLEGVFIDPKDNKYLKKLMTKKHWFPNTFTFGVGVTAIYDGQPKLLFGPTLSYNLYEW